MIRKASLRETVTIIRSILDITSPVPDRYGNPPDEEVAGVNVPAQVEPALFSAGAADESEINRDTRISMYTVLVAPDVNVDGLARVVWRTRSFEVIGEPRSFQARNGVHHYEFDMREILG